MIESKRVSRELSFPLETRGNRTLDLIVPFGRWGEWIDVFSHTGSTTVVFNGNIVSRPGRPAFIEGPVQVEIEYHNISDLRLRDSFFLPAISRKLRAGEHGNPAERMVRVRFKSATSGTRIVAHIN